MNNVRPSVNVQCYTKKQTQSLPIDNNGCCVFHDYRWCPKYVPSSAERNMSESWEFCENRTDSTLVLNLGTSCLSYFRPMNHSGVSTCFHSSLLLLKFNGHTSHFNGFFVFYTWETRKIQANQVIQTLLLPSTVLHRSQVQWLNSVWSDWQSQDTSALTSWLPVAEVTRCRRGPARGQLCSVHHWGALRNGPVHWHRFQNCCFKREWMSVLVIMHNSVYSCFKQYCSCNLPQAFAINSAITILWTELKEWESLVLMTQKLINKELGENQQVVSFKVCWIKLHFQSGEYAVTCTHNKGTWTPRFSTA